MFHSCQLILESSWVELRTDEFKDLEQSHKVLGPTLTDPLKQLKEHGWALARFWYVLVETPMGFPSFAWWFHHLPGPSI